MATEQTPLEPDLREPRRRSREFNALLWLGGWGGAAAIALTALAVASQTKTAGERLRQIFAINEPAAIAQMPPRVTQLESNVQLLTAQVRALAVERDRLAGRIALLESSVDDMTGAIKRQAAATRPPSPQKRRRRRQPRRFNDSRRHASSSAAAAPARTSTAAPCAQRRMPSNVARADAADPHRGHTRQTSLHRPPTLKANLDSISAAPRRWTASASAGSR